MTVTIQDIIEEIKDATEWQKVPSDVNYERIVTDAIRQLYVHTGRSDVYDIANFEGPFELNADEYHYVILTAKIRFFDKVATDVNNIVGYTTDALSITNADKPYANLKNTLDELKNERRIVYYKMIRYTIM